MEKRKISKKANQRGSWNKEQKSLIKDYFKNHLKNKKTPKKQECLEFQKKYMSLFHEKTWIQIKVFVYNTFRSN